MARGTLVLVVGPSGVGKDSVIAGAAERLCADPRYVFPRRLITRPETAGGEAHVALSPAEFAARRDAGGLLLHWRAHGLDYGLPQGLDTELDAGRCAVANVSRTVVAQARREFAPVAVVAISAAPQTLAARLAGRGREDAAEIERRLQRAVPADPPDVTIDNDGTLGEAVDRFVEILRALQPPSG
jgi:phosphonate metabolism protein PhnN/1,5-bisphosphokinase (PRPP-forming)